jgi:protoporphyrin/coproporphyrin ferrochelatase
MSKPAEKTALVLLNMGGPASLEGVRPFLFNVFSDRELIRLPAGALLQKPFALLISALRARRVRLNYQAIGGRSPLLDWTRRQAQGITDRLGAGWFPCVAMRYTAPRSGEVVAQLKADGVRRAVVLSMYPHYTGATTGSSLNDFKLAVARRYPELELRFIEQWYDWPGYLDALANRIEQGLERFHELLRDEVEILFSAHALPQKFIDEGDPYLEHVQATVRGVMERVGERPWHLGFQSRSGPVEWMEPDTVAVMDRLAAEGKSEVLIVPISFVSDHIETLYEIDIEYRHHAELHGLKHFVRAPSLNDGADFLDAMAELVRSGEPSDG